MVKRPFLGRGKDGKIKEKLEMEEMMISAGTDWMNSFAYA
jgi:hypothetical protein